MVACSPRRCVPARESQRRPRPCGQTPVWRWGGALRLGASRAPKLLSLGRSVERPWKTHLQDGFAVRVPPAPTPTPAVPEFMLHAHEHGMALGHGMPLRAHNSTVPNCTSTRRRRRASTQQHSTAPTLTVNDAHHDNDDNRQPTTAKSKLRLRPPPPASKHPSKHPSTGKWQPLSTRTGLRRPKPAKLLPPPLPSPPVAVVIV